MSGIDPYVVIAHLQHSPAIQQEVDALYWHSLYWYLFYFLSMALCLIITICCLHFIKCQHYEGKHLWVPFVIGILGLVGVGWFSHDLIIERTWMDILFQRPYVTVNLIIDKLDVVVSSHQR